MLFAVLSLQLFKWRPAEHSWGRGQFEYFAGPDGTIGRRWGPLDSLGHFRGPAEPCSDGPWVMPSMGVGWITHGPHKAWVLRPRSRVKLGALWAPVLTTTLLLAGLNAWTP